MKRLLIVAAVVLPPIAAFADTPSGGTDPIEDPPPTTQPPPSPEDAAPVLRLDCEGPNDTEAGTRVVQRRLRDHYEFGGTRFRATVRIRTDLLYDAPGALLYARRSEDRQKSLGIELGDQGTPGTYWRSLPLARGRWWIGCFSTPFYTRQHDRPDYAVIRVVDET